MYIVKSGEEPCPHTRARCPGCHTTLDVAPDDYRVEIEYCPEGDEVSPSYPDTQKRYRVSCPCCGADVNIPESEVPYAVKRRMPVLVARTKTTRLESEE